MKKHRAIDCIVFNLLMRTSAKDKDPIEDGGPGSGNHNHAGRPGEVGGSAPAEGATKSEAAKGKRTFTPEQSEAIKAYTAKGGQYSSRYPMTMEKNNALAKLANESTEKSPGLWRKQGISNADKEKLFYDWYNDRPVDVQFKRFESFTEEKRRAHTFANREESEILYHIPEGLDIHGVDIQDESIYGIEKEHLVGSDNKFRVSNITFDEHTGLMIVELETAEKQEPAVPAIKKVDPARFIPKPGEPRYSRHQGWNRERNEYLQECGFDKADVNTLNWLIDNHVHYAHSADDEMAKFIKDHPDLIKAVGEYEAAAAKTRQELKAADLDRDIKYAREHAEWLKQTWPEEAEYVDRDLETQTKRYEREKRELTESPMLYRKGGYDSPVLSFTTNPQGTTLYAGTDYEENLIPDHQGSLDDLMKQGIIPVSGFGAINNFYGESEVTFVNTNAGTPAKE